MRGGKIDATIKTLLETVQSESGPECRPQGGGQEGALRPPGRGPGLAADAPAGDVLEGQ